MGFESTDEQNTHEKMFLLHVSLSNITSGFGQAIMLDSDCMLKFSINSVGKMALPRWLSKLPKSPKLLFSSFSMSQSTNNNCISSILQHSNHVSDSNYCCDHQHHGQRFFYACICALFVCSELSCLGCFDCQRRQERRQTSTCVCLCVVSLSCLANDLPLHLRQ